MKSETAEPFLHRGKIDLVIFDSMQTDAQYALTGDHFCWTTDKEVQILNLLTESRKKICLKSFISYTGDDSFVPFNFQLDASDIRACLEAGMLSSKTIDKSGVDWLAN